jgi:hypothetical protein
MPAAFLYAFLRGRRVGGRITARGLLYLFTALVVAPILWLIETLIGESTFTNAAAVQLVLTAFNLAEIVLFFGFLGLAIQRQQGGYAVAALILLILSAGVAQANVSSATAIVLHLLGTTLGIDTALHKMARRFPA